MLDDDDSLSETSGRGGRRRDGSIKSEEMEETCWLDSLTLAVPKFPRKRKT